MNEDNTWETRMAARATREPRLHLLETSWRAIHAKSQRVLTCGVYETDAGFEVRAGYGDLQLLRSQYAADLAVAREIGDVWRAATLGHGSFTELGKEGGQ